MDQQVEVLDKGFANFANAASLACRRVDHVLEVPPGTKAAYRAGNENDPHRCSRAYCRQRAPVFGNAIGDKTSNDGVTHVQMDA